MTGARNDPMSEVPPLLDESKTNTARMFTLDLKKKTAEERIDLGHDTAVNRLVPGKNLIASLNGTTLSLYDTQTGKLKFHGNPQSKYLHPALDRTAIVEAVAGGARHLRPQYRGSFAFFLMAGILPQALMTAHFMCGISRRGISEQQENLIIGASHRTVRGR